MNEMLHERLVASVTLAFTQGVYAYSTYFLRKLLVLALSKPLKQSPSRRRARKSIGDEDVPISTRDINPVISVGVPRPSLRTSHRTNSEKKEKKVERLFASSNARADEREPLQEEEDEFVSKPMPGQL
ncbi:unnamed protein product [Strongylus vulgaris]|uniref:Uncharacterized protein n=1 Tax=Strongylus vulgaris TaxID=40348 RepID=A0A3P7II93_STRVU|nr:unnamed protein product [Strongylus vulgaris]